MPPEYRTRGGHPNGPQPSDKGVETMSCSDTAPERLNSWTGYRRNKISAQLSDWRSAQSDPQCCSPTLEAANEENSRVRKDPDGLESGVSLNNSKVTAAVKSGHLIARDT